MWGNWATASELKNQTETLLVHMDPILLKKFQPQFTLRWILSILIGCFKSCDHYQRQATAHHSTTTGQKLKFKSFKAVEKRNGVNDLSCPLKIKPGCPFTHFLVIFFQISESLEALNQVLSELASWLDEWHLILVLSTTYSLK